MQLQGRRDVESLNYVTNKIVCFPLNREFKDDDWNFEEGMVLK